MPTTTPPPPSFSTRLLSIASSQVGVCEEPKGSNRGKQVEKYLGSVGLPGGNPWCMAFVHWCVQQACAETHAINPLFKSGHVLTVWNKASVAQKSHKPAPGDVFIMRFGNTGTGHTGFVEKVEGLFVYTIEGNTNDDGSREGYEVARRRRLISSIVGFIKVNPARI